MMNIHLPPLLILIYSSCLLPNCSRRLPRQSKPPMDVLLLPSGTFHGLRPRALRIITPINIKPTFFNYHPGLDLRYRGADERYADNRPSSSAYCQYLSDRRHLSILLLVPAQPTDLPARTPSAA